MERLLTPEAAAEKLAVSVKTVKNLLRSGKLHGVKVGNLWRLREEALEEYLKNPARSSKPLTANGETTVSQTESPSVLEIQVQNPFGPATMGNSFETRRIRRAPSWLGRD